MSPAGTYLSSRFWPTHTRPPCLGVGLLQERCRTWKPMPQVVLQGDQEVQGVQPPFLWEKKWFHISVKPAQTLGSVCSDCKCSCPVGGLLDCVEPQPLDRAEWSPLLLWVPLQLASNVKATNHSKVAYFAWNTYETLVMRISNFRMLFYCKVLEMNPKPINSQFYLTPITSTIICEQYPWDRKIT